MTRLHLSAACSAVVVAALAAMAFCARPANTVPIVLVLTPTAEPTAARVLPTATPAITHEVPRIRIPSATIVQRG